MNKSLIRRYRNFRRSLSKIAGRSSLSKVDQVRLKEIISENRRALSLVHDWLPAGLLESSVFRYGVTPEVQPLLNLPLDNECCEADLLAYYGRTCGAPLKYLELGVSVGKTLWQILHSCAPCECWGFDIEEINPVLKQHFALDAREEWPSRPESIKKTPSSISRFTHQPTGSKLTYICSDIFDDRAWKLLAGCGFNLILSDALHSPQALDFEWAQMTRLNIFDPQSVAIMWDDLNGEIRDWFQAKRSTIAGQLNVNLHNVDMFFLNGWLGKREYPHRIGLALGKQRHS